MNVFFSHRAEIQLDRIHAYIMESSGYERRADEFVERIQIYCLGLQHFPERGTQYNNILKGLRVVGFENSVSIAFIIKESELEILGIYYRGQNWHSDFDD